MKKSGINKTAQYYYDDELGHVVSTSSRRGDYFVLMNEVRKKLKVKSIIPDEKCEVNVTKKFVHPRTAKKWIVRKLSSSSPKRIVEKIIPLPEFPISLMNRNEKVEHIHIVLKYLVLSLCVESKQGCDGIIFKFLFEVQKLYPRSFSDFLVLLRCLRNDCEKEIQTLCKSNLPWKSRTFIDLLNELIRNAEEYEIDFESRYNSWSKIPVDSLLHVIFPFLGITDLIRITRTCKSFQEKIWEVTLKNRSEKLMFDEMDLFFLFDNVGVVSDTVLSKLVKYNAIPIPLIFTYTYPFLFENDYKLTLSTLAGMKSIHKLLVIDHINEYGRSNMKRKWYKISIEDILSDNRQFSRYILFRWNRRFGVRRKSEIVPFLRFAQSIKPKNSPKFRSARCMELFECILGSGNKNMSLEFYLEALHLLSHFFCTGLKRKSNRAHSISFLSLLVSSLPIKSLFVTEEIVRETVDFIVDETFPTITENLSNHVKSCCLRFSRSDNLIFNTFFVPMLVSKCEVDPSFSKCCLLLTACSGNYPLVRYLLYREEVRKQLEEEHNSRLQLGSQFPSGNMNRFLLAATTSMKSSIFFFKSPYYIIHKNTFYNIVKALLDTNLCSYPSSNYQIIRSLLVDINRQTNRVYQYQMQNYEFNIVESWDEWSRVLDLLLSQYCSVDNTSRSDLNDLLLISVLDQGIRNTPFLKTLLKFSPLKNNFRLHELLCKEIIEKKKIHFLNLTDLFADERFEVPEKYHLKFFLHVFVESKVNPEELFFPLLERSKVAAEFVDIIFREAVICGRDSLYKRFPDWKSKVREVSGNLEDEISGDGEYDSDDSD